MKDSYVVTTGVSGYRTVAVLALLPVIMILIATEGSPGISGDSVTYASTLRELQETGQWRFNALFPPGLPILVALIGVQGAFVVNVLALWATLVLVFFLGLRVTGSRFAAGLAVAWFGTSSGTLHIYSMLWTEPLFCLVTVTTLGILVDQGERRELTGSRALALTVLLNAACLLRYSAVALIVFTALVLTWKLRYPVLKRLLIAALIALTGSISFIGYLLTNVLSNQPVMGPRLPPRTSTGGLSAELFSLVGNYFMNGTYSQVGVYLGMLVVVVLGGIAAALLLRSGLLRVLQHPAAILLAWCLLYVAFIVYSSSTTYLNPVNLLGGRMLAPVIAPAAIVVASVLTRAARRPVGDPLRATAVGYVLAIALVSGSWVIHTNRTGMWYEALAARSPELAAAVASHVPNDATLVSNHPLLLAWITQRDLIRGVPDAGPMPAGDPYTYDVGKDARPGDYLVWLKCCYQRAGWPTQPTVHVAEGKTYSIYRVKSDPSRAASSR